MDGCRGESTGGMLVGVELVGIEYLVVLVLVVNVMYKSLDRRPTLTIAAQQPCIPQPTHRPQDPHRTCTESRRAQISNQQSAPSLSTAAGMATQKPPALPTLSSDEAGVMGLTEVEPSPVDETPAEYKDGYFPDSRSSPEDHNSGAENFSAPKRSTTLGLGISHGPVWWCTSSFPPIIPPQTKKTNDMKIQQYPASKNTPPTHSPSSPPCT
jgi:hypothetical protein